MITSLSTEQIALNLPTSRAGNGNNLFLCHVDVARSTRILTRACTCSSSAETWAMRRRRRRFRMAWLERLCRSYITWFWSSKISPLRMLISSTGGPPEQRCLGIKRAKQTMAARSCPSVRWSHPLKDHLNKDVTMSLSEELPDNVMQEQNLTPQNTDLVHSPVRM